ncbi:MAG: hypothetical protein OEQ24_11495, partial [Gammaproteobacteria bacterium]|nr:hypothetical protein [Gammaproteobacteria bacterium]
MLTRMKNFFKTTVIGGIIVILPTIILIFAFRWLFGVVGSVIEPLTNLVKKNLSLPEHPEQMIATAMVISVIVLSCFLVGLFVRTRMGLIIYKSLEGSLLSKAPGYKMVKETVNQLLGKKESPFSSVALAQVFGN